ncbi:hypothetical protein V8E54_002511 [Elaphomyces granulatus]
MATTPSPPPPSTLRTPPTPKHGAGYDSYEPYPIRYSTRLASQRIARDLHTTPPPKSPPMHPRLGSMSTRDSTVINAGTLSPPGSVNNSPKKRLSGRTRHTIAADTISTTEAEEHKLPSQHAVLPTTTITSGMLPTPAKTPRKKPVGEIGSTAKTLFQSASGPGRTRKSKKYNGFSLESFHDDPSERQEHIEIFTDSRDKIPKADEREDNPFYEGPDDATAIPTEVTSSRTSKRRRVEIKRPKEVQDALDCEDGMMYVFRGKKTFRKFDDDVDAESDGDDLGLLGSRPDLMDSSLDTRVRPLTRSSIKPRVLFPTARQRHSKEAHSGITDEEATTDIDDHASLSEPDVEVGHAADASLEQSPVTPPAKTTATTPSSPGASSRSLRSHDRRGTLDHEEMPSGTEPKKEKRISPFGIWKRKKQTPSSSTRSKVPKKRDVGSIASAGGPATKKTKGR